MRKTYEKQGQSIDYIILRKPIKNTYFRLKSDVIQVTTNKHTSEASILKFLDQKFDVFHQKLNHIKLVETDDIITLWGIQYHLIITSGKFDYHIEKDTLWVSFQLKDYLLIKKKIYLVEMQKKLKEILPTMTPILHHSGITTKTIKLKYLKSKFGSYHKKHDEITLNTFLARLDPIYLTYVIYHEYAHVLIFNHSKSFYKVLDLWMPNHKNYQKDLKKIAIH